MRFEMVSDGAAVWDFDAPNTYGAVCAVAEHLIHVERVAGHVGVIPRDGEATLWWWDMRGPPVRVFRSVDVRRVDESFSKFFAESGVT